MDGKYFCTAVIAASLSITACDKSVNEGVTKEGIKIVASSVHQTFGPVGLLTAEEPGWHAKSPPVYPETVTFILVHPQPIGQIGFLPQEGHENRAPKKFVVETSDDAKTWKELATLESNCAAPSQNWRDLPLGGLATASNIRIKILSNCGDPAFLTLRGVRFK